MLKGKIAVITGANRGIGWATVEKFAAHRACVWACARKQTEVFEKQIEDLAEKYSTQVRPLYFDVTDADEAKKAMKTVGDAHKCNDILVYNAGVYVAQLVQMTPT